jgi:hypothetical protein
MMRSLQVIESNSVLLQVRYLPRSRGFEMHRRTALVEHVAAAGDMCTSRSSVLPIRWSCLSRWFRYRYGTGHYTQQVYVAAAADLSCLRC